ncbi:hypothetical protein [Rhizobium grahamii]|uniref:Uncharacterized protein n=1 Tax=Rhizobium grahamii TaxID=1120045 RepID=A0A370KUH8_9HYPH|nr:hypothetical protein [Rhizobium grahamii]RDJ13934.1 hypothetical protein B5K06_08175 [Rhizobium grahamii]
MKERDLKELGEALLQEVSSDITPKKLIKAVQKTHPDASKKEIVRAAFYALIANAHKVSDDKATKLHAFATNESRSGDL